MDVVRFICENYLLAVAGPTFARIIYKEATQEKAKEEEQEKPIVATVDKGPTEAV